MKSLVQILEDRISQSLRTATGLDVCPALVAPSKSPQFGDYQANGVMAAAKQIGVNPRQLAQQVVAILAIEDLCESPQIAGPGFINLRLKTSLLEKRLLGMFTDKARLGIDKTRTPKTIVVDYSGPNIAKEMHVGHLRSTILGDCISRLLEFEGHIVIRQNHIGDWGTQFGKVILALWHLCMARKRGLNTIQTDQKYLLEHSEDAEAIKAYCRNIRDRHEQDYEEDKKNVRGDGELYFGPFLELLPTIKEQIWPQLLEAYQFVNTLEELSENLGLTILTRKINNGQSEYISIPYESLSRHITAMLQKGGAENSQELNAWKCIKEITLAHCSDIYKTLNSKLTANDVRGESFYNPFLANVVKELRDKGLAVESEGAICVFPEGFVNKEGAPLPFIIQKSDGAYLYATTDLAALRFRIEELKADQIIYVTDARQALHFQMLFAAAKAAGWTDRQVDLIHVTFGTMLGADGRPFRTREGGTVKLQDLLEEAAEKARAVVEEKNPDLPESQKVQIAQAVGIGAVKYADYSNNRDSDYVFSFDKMLAMDGNTAPYMQYAYARIRSIERKSEGKEVDIERELREIQKTLALVDSSEIDLAKKLIQYDQAIEAAALQNRPNYLTSYLYDLSQTFSRFYNACPVLQAVDNRRPTRLLLCDLTARVIRHGMEDLLGITMPRQM